MAIKKDTLDGLLAGHDPQAVFAKDGLAYAPLIVAALVWMQSTTYIGHSAARRILGDPV
jgi:hypothetical protein